MEDVGLFYGLLVYFTAIWSILWPFCIFVPYLVNFFPFWYAIPRKIWQPWSAIATTATTSWQEKKNSFLIKGGLV
jgi:hypothetical protein